MRINSPYITGSAIITGNLCVQGTITGTITGIASTASYAETLDGLDSTQFVQTGSFNSYTSSASSSLGDLSGSVATTTSNLSSSVGSLSGSVATTTSGLGTRITTIEGNYATTGSNQFVGSQTITGSLTTTGQIIAQTINVQQVTSSIVYSSGSNIFGNSISNTQQFTGSILASGSLLVNGFVNIERNDAALFVLDSSPFASCVGGKISLQGNYRSAGDITEGGYIKVSKTNSNDGDYGFDLIFANHTYPSTVSEKMRISSTGNVGIGCVNPGYKLDINGNTNIAGTLNIQSTNNINWNGGDVGISNDSTALVFKTYSSSTLNEKMRITCDGRIGINIVSPQSSLHIIKSLGSNVFAIGEADSNIRFAIGQEAGYTGNYINSSNIDLKIQSYLASGSGGNLYFQTANDGTNNVLTRLRITSGGDLILGISNYDPKLYMTSTGGNGINERFYIDGYAHGGGSEYGGGFRLYTRDTVNIFHQRLTVDSSGIACFSNTICTKSLWFSSNSTGQITFGANDTCNPYIVSDSNNALYLGNNNSYKIFVPNDGANMIFRTSSTYGNPETRLTISSTGISTFASTVCAPNAVINCLGMGAAWSTYGGTYQPIQIKAGLSNSGLWIESCENDSGIYINHNSTSGLIGGSYRATAGFKDLSFQTAGVTRMTIKCAGTVTIGTDCAAFGRRLTVGNDIVSYFSNEENITMGLSAGTGPQSWGIQVCDTGDGGNALHLNARGGNVGINKGSGNVASHALDVTGVINSTDRVQAPQIVAGIQNYSQTRAHTFSTSAGGTNVFNIDIASLGLQVAGNYQTADVYFQAGLYPGATTVNGRIGIVARGGANVANLYAITCIGGIGTVTITPYGNGTSTFGLCLTSNCTSSAVYWAAIVNAMSV